MRVYSRRAKPPVKDQQPFFGAKEKGKDTAQSFFKSGGIQRKEGLLQKAAEEEQNKQIAPETKKPEEEQKVQKAIEPEKEQKDKEPVQKKAIRRKINNQSKAIQPKSPEAAREATPELEKKLLASKGKGFALPDDLIQELNSEMNYDFSSVVIHTDAEAIEMAEELGALAFTHGQDIYFNNGQYTPYSPAGKQLLVHELTHVMQQN